MTLAEQRAENYRLLQEIYASNSDIGPIPMIDDHIKKKKSHPIKVPFMVMVESLKFEPDEDQEAIFYLRMNFRSKETF